MPVHPRACGERPHFRSDGYQFYVHPRACGERGITRDLDMYSIRSSPRLRGTPRSPVIDPFARPFIPAPAGNAKAPLKNLPLIPVHPRACGERTMSEIAGALAVRSSPRLRGTPNKSCPQMACPPFIPAPAGNASNPSGLWLWMAVHPRACGERRSR